jgi:hypothetical protein
VMMSDQKKTLKFGVSDTLLAAKPDETDPERALRPPGTAPNPGPSIPNEPPLLPPGGSPSGSDEPRPIAPRPMPIAVNPSPAQFIAMKEAAAAAAAAEAAEGDEGEDD